MEYQQKGPTVTQHGKPRGGSPAYIYEDYLYIRSNEEEKHS